MYCDVVFKIFWIYSHPHTFFIFHVTYWNKFRFKSNCLLLPARLFQNCQPVGKVQHVITYLTFFSVQQSTAMYGWSSLSCLDLLSSVLRTVSWITVWNTISRSHGNEVRLDWPAINPNACLLFSFTLNFFSFLSCFLSVSYTCSRIIGILQENIPGPMWQWLMQDRDTSCIR